MYLTVPDYAVTAVMLMIPLAIGVFYAWKDSEKVNREEYLLGGRQMGMLPVSMSMFITFMSAVSLMGSPGDVYTAGSMLIYLHIGIALSNLISCYTMIPLLYPLHLTSIYDYLEMRYESRAVRLLSTVIGMMQTFFYMVVALLAPGLAVQTAAGIPFWMSVIIVGSIGTVYTAIGGIKSVIWTDAFQTLIVFAGVFVLIGRGVYVVGGVENVWNIAQEGGRTELLDFNPDPRVRHTIWGGIFGMTFTWLTNMFNQSTMQRMSSMKNIQSAKKAFLLNAPCNLFYGVLLSAMGLTMYAYFHELRCDPLDAGIVSNQNQIVLTFVLDAYKSYPGLAGLFMATLFSGALSTLSSGINALACNTVEDILGTCLRRFSEKNITILAKALVVAYGIVIIGFAYLSKSLKGPVTQMGISIFGACGSAILAIFITGCTVPWANKYGAIAGGTISLIINSWIVVGSRLYGSKPITLAPLPTDGCGSLFNDSWTSPDAGLLQWTPRVNVTTITMTITSVSPATDDGHSDNSFFLYDVSYLWYGLIGTLVSSFMIVFVSYLTRSRQKTKTDARLILPQLRKFWNLDELQKVELDEI